MEMGNADAHNRPDVGSMNEYQALTPEIPQSRAVTLCIGNNVVQFWKGQGFNPRMVLRTARAATLQMM